MNSVDEFNFEGLISFQFVGFAFIYQIFYSNQGTEREETVPLMLCTYPFLCTRFFNMYSLGYEFSMKAVQYYMYIRAVGMSKRAGG